MFTRLFLSGGMMLLACVSCFAQVCLNVPAAPETIFQTSLLDTRRGGELVFEVDVTPRAGGASMDGGVSLARGKLGAFDDMTLTVRFNNMGFVDMRDGGVYRSDRSIPYSANETYHVKVILNTSTRRYSAYIRPLSSVKPIPIGENYAFRSGNTATAFDLWGAFADIGSLTACNGVVYASLKPSESLWLDGVRAFVEVPDRDALSIPTTGALTVSAWIRPSTLAFPVTEGSGYVDFLGKGDKSGPMGNREWWFRIYSAGNSENRANRISFYVFNPEGAHGNGSYFQDPMTPNEWIHVVAVADMEHTYLYKNGTLRDCDKHRASASGSCNPPFVEVQPRNGSAPFRIGSVDFESFFQGSVRDVRVWNRALAAQEIASLYSGSVNRSGLVAEFLLRNDFALDTAGSSHGVIYGMKRVP